MSTTLSELTDAYIDEFIAKLKEEIKLKPAVARSPPSTANAPSVEKSSEKSEKPPSDEKPIEIENLPWTIETVFY